MNRTVKYCLAGAGVLTLAASAGLNFLLASVITGRDTESPFKHEVLEGSPSSPSTIAVIDIEGVITSAGDLQREDLVAETVSKLRFAEKSDAVKSIVLRINSPGGDVVSSDILYRAVLKCNETKPVVVLMGGMAASGGYYTALGGSYIVANELTVTGSIGVIIEAYNYVGIIEKLGVTRNVYKSGMMKDMLSSTRLPTAEENEHIRHMIDRSFAKFKGIVESRRGLKLDTLEIPVGDGRTIQGGEAQRLGLIDRLGYMEDAIAKARELGKIQGEHVVVRITRHESLSGLLDFFVKAPTSELQALSGFVPKLFRLQAGVPYFLASPTP